MDERFARYREASSAHLRRTRSPRRHGLAMARAVRIRHWRSPKLSPITPVREHHQLQSRTILIAFAECDVCCAITRGDLKYVCSARRPILKAPIGFASGCGVLYTTRYASWFFCNAYFVKYSRDRRIVTSLGSQQVADISISSSPPFPPPVRRVIFAFCKSSAVNPFLRRTCLAKVTSLSLIALISWSRSSLLARIRAWA